MPRRRRINEYFGEPSRQESRDCISRDEAEIIAKISAEKVFSLFSERILSLLETCIRKIEEIEKKIDSIQKPREPVQGQARKSRTSRAAERLEEYLDKNRFILLSEARQKLRLPPSRTREIAEEIGAVVLELEGDVAIILPEYLEEYDALLAETRTPDPAEASRRLGMYSRLFDKMRRSGLVYFDAARGSWRRLE